jgi:glucose-1-phosphate adenylyltransferase
MPKPKTLTLIMAGGAGKRMGLLTKFRAKPSLPFAGVYRLIDFPLTNCVHSGLQDVWVIEQFEPQSLNDHLANGRPWDLDRTYGGLRILPPRTGTDAGGWHKGNADAIYRNRRFVREFAPDVVVVLSADHVYKLDYGTVIEAHHDRRADVTLVTTVVPREKVRKRFGNVVVDAHGKVTDFAYKPEEPLSEIVTTEVFVYSGKQLLDILDSLASEAEANQEDSLQDFGHTLLPRMVDNGQAYAFPLDGYWRDVGVVADYWEAHMELLRVADPTLRLDDPAWPILTYGVQRMPARVHDTATIRNSLIAPGCVIKGHVDNSVLSPGVVVEDGAVVRDAILFEHALVSEGADVSCAIIDAKAVVGKQARVGRAVAEQRSDKLQITVVGAQARVVDQMEVAPGEEVEGPSLEA